MFGLYVGGGATLICRILVKVNGESLERRADVSRYDIRYGFPGRLEMGEAIQVEVFPMELKLDSSKWFGKDVCSLIFCANVFELNLPL